MAQHITSIYELEQLLKRDKQMLKEAKDDKDKERIKAYTKAVKNSELKLKAAKNALKGTAK